MAISGSSVSNTRSARCISTFKRIALVSVLGLVLANCTTSTKALLSEARTPSKSPTSRSKHCATAGQLAGSERSAFTVKASGSSAASFAADSSLER